MKNSQNRGVSRRTFLTGAAVTAAGATALAALGGCSPSTGSDDSGSADSGDYAIDEATGRQYPWAAEPTAISDGDIEEEIDCDVAVIGLGVSGCAAFRAAAEAGAKTVAFEKAETVVCRSSQYCYLNGKYSAQLGLKDDFDLEELFENEWGECACITNQAIVRKFLYGDAEAVEWWIEGGDVYVPAKGETLNNNMMTGESDPDHPLNVTAMSDLTIDYKHENQAAYPECISFSDHQAVLENNVAKGTDAGGTTYFGHFAEQLITDDDGRVVGVYVRNAESSKYKKVNAANGVVMAMGDGASNPDIMNYFYPQVVDAGNLNPWPNQDVEGNNTNTGDVYKMGYWAGAGFSSYQAPMTHVMGGPGDTNAQSDSMGFTGPMLRLNYNGVRFQNEDVAATECEFAFDIQPKKKAFMVVDSNFEEYAKLAVNTFTSSLSDYDAAVGDGVHFKGETLEELFGSIDGMNVDAAVASVERYNKMCKKGKDTDFHKKKKYLTPVEKGPFYAVRMGQGLCLCTMGGIHANENSQALTSDSQPIPGLYVSGNAMGDRFAVKYPFKLSGTSHAMAMMTGKVAGENAAAKLS